jgi:hypothetical protein
MQYRNRYQSPTLGRFISRDPIGYKAGMNLYAYVNAHPVDGTDPMGLDRVGRDGDIAFFQRQHTWGGNRGPQMTIGYIDADDKVHFVGVFSVIPDMRWVDVEAFDRRWTIDTWEELLAAIQTEAQRRIDSCKRVCDLLEELCGPASLGLLPGVIDLCKAGCTLSGQLGGTCQNPTTTAHCLGCPGGFVPFIGRCRVCCAGLGEDATRCGIACEQEWRRRRQQSGR